MRQGPNGRRGRGRPHPGASDRQGGQGNNNSNNTQRRSAASLRNQSFDSNGPDVRVRGNAWQVHEKYQSLARDAAAAGDRIAAENYLQHAEHYYRIIEAINEAAAAEQQTRGFGSGQPSYYAPSTGAAPQPDGQLEVRGTLGFTPTGVQSSAEQASLAAPLTTPFFTAADAADEPEEALQIAPAAAGVR